MSKIERQAMLSRGKASGSVSKTSLFQKESFNSQEDRPCSGRPLFVLPGVTETPAKWLCRRSKYAYIFPYYRQQREAPSLLYFSIKCSSCSSHLSIHSIPISTLPASLAPLLRFLLRHPLLVFGSPDDGLLLARLLALHAEVQELLAKVLQTWRWSRWRQKP